MRIYTIHGVLLSKHTVRLLVSKQIESYHFMQSVIHSLSSWAICIMHRAVTPLLEKIYSDGLWMSNSL